MMVSRRRISFGNKEKWTSYEMGFYARGGIFINARREFAISVAWL
jgi:hypothetical protein